MNTLVRKLSFVVVVILSSFRAAPVLAQCNSSDYCLVAAGWMCAYESELICPNWPAEQCTYVDNCTCDPNPPPGELGCSCDFFCT